MTLETTLGNNYESGHSSRRDFLGYLGLGIASLALAKPAYAKDKTKEKPTNDDEEIIISREVWDRTCIGYTNPGPVKLGEANICYYMSSTKGKYINVVVGGGLGISAFGASAKSQVGLTLTIKQGTSKERIEKILKSEMFRLGKDKSKNPDFKEPDQMIYLKRDSKEYDSFNGPKPFYTNLDQILKDMEQNKK